MYTRLGIFKVKHIRNHIGKASAIALVLALSCAAVGVNAAADVSKISTQSSTWEQDKIVADAKKQIDQAKKEIEKERKTIDKEQKKIAEERQEIEQEKAEIAEQREIIASAEGKNKDKDINKARKKIVKSQHEIAKSRSAIEKSKEKIAEARAQIIILREIIAVARDVIASTRDSDNDGVANNIDLCPDTPVGEAVDADGCPLVPESDWDLVWSDEFDGDAIDTSKWNFEVNCSGGGNQEQQCYTSNSENAFVENGVLNLVALPATGQPLPYSSARLNSKNKGDWTYGRFEIRAKAGSGQGSWPAIWMLSTDEEYGFWPHSGEIDIFESVNLGVPLNDGTGAVQTAVYGTLHYGKSFPNNDSSGLAYLLPNGENPADDFHVYTIEWEEGEIRWYVDDVLYETQLKSEVRIDEDGDANGLDHKGWYTEDIVSGDGLVWDNAPFDKRFNLILNFAVGGSFPSSNGQGIDASAFNASNAFEIDYVRVFECSVAPTTGQGCASVRPGYLDPVDDGGTLIEGKAPAPVKPSTGVGTDLLIFDNAITDSWPVFVSAATGSFSVVFDQDAIEPDHFEVVQFTFGAEGMVAGFNTTIASTPAPYDGSPLVNTGVLEFDLKLETPPNTPGVTWFLKVEQAGQTSTVELPIATPAVGIWQHYAISLNTLNNAGLILNGIDVVMVFPAFGQGEGTVFKIDNVTILEGDAPPPIPPTGSELTDFEDTPDSYVFNNFAGGVAEVIGNPGVVGSNNIDNTSAQVGQMQKFFGEVFGGSTLILDKATDIPAATVIGLKVYSPRQVKVLFKLEGLNVERSVTHNGTGWEELSFDFSGDSGTGVEAITLIFDLGVNGDAAGDPSNWTFYFDDMILPGAGDTGGGNGIAAIDFEPAGTGNAGFSWTVFENDDNPPLEIVANPDTSGANSSATVAKFIARQTGAPFAGVETAHGNIGPLTLDASNSTIKIMVYKSVISDMGVKFAIANGGAQAEIKVANTLINQWEELSFDFSGNIGLFESINIDQLIVFPDFDSRTQDNVVYFDNITFSGDGSGGGGGGTGSAVTDFEDAPGSYLFNDFAGGVASVVMNPVIEGINTSAQVGQMLKFTGEVFGGSTLTLDGPVDIAADTVINLKVWSQRAVAVLFKLEGMNVERSVNHTGTGWEELSFDFTGDSGTGVGAITLIFDLGVIGDAAGDPLKWTFYFDDMTLPEANGGGGGGSSVSTLDFEPAGSGDIGFSWNVFENADNPPLEIVANPDTSGVNSSATVAKFIARQTGAPFAGVETAHGNIGPFTLDASNSIIKIMVFKSVISDVGLKFAIANGGAQAEIKVANTLINQWEELSFDFSGNIGKFESINIDQVIVFPDFDFAGRLQDNVVYFDNISFSN